MEQSYQLLSDFYPEEWELPDEARFRREQIADWLFQKRVTSVEQMTNLPKSLRSYLAERYVFQALELEKVQGSEDTTRKYLWRLNRGDYIESVLIPASPALYGERSDRFTLCVSSQVGCAYGCKFCASGLLGFRRHLTPGEILAQIMEAERHSGQAVSNIVFMGMGEPLANFDNLIKAIDMINAPWGLNIGARRITVSTSGLVPEILKLADYPKQIRLALSLHGASNAVRAQIMPINRKYPVEQLLDACEVFQEKKRKMITFEYILIAGVNDAPEEAERLARHARRLHAKINLIPYNRVEGLSWERPSEDAVDAFASVVQANGITATLRREKGHDIDAACGQLRLRELQAG